MKMRDLIGTDARETVRRLASERPVRALAGAPVQYECRGVCTCNAEFCFARNANVRADLMP